MTEQPWFRFRPGSLELWHRAAEEPTRPRPPSGLLLTGCGLSYAEDPSLDREGDPPANRRCPGAASRAVRHAIDPILRETVG